MIKTVKDHAATKTLLQWTVDVLRLRPSLLFNDFSGKFHGGEDMTLTGISLFDCIEKFKKHCFHSKNWKVYEGADLIRVKNKFHKFVWTQHLRPSTFESMIRNPLCAIAEGVLYKNKSISFMAFVVPQPPSAEILKFFEEEPNIQKWIALYDLSCIFGNDPICAKLNKTKSPVFHEFESFLTSHYDVKFESITPLRNMNPMIL